MPGALTVQALALTLLAQSPMPLCREAAERCRERVARYLSEARRSPIEALSEAAADHDVVILGDLHPAAAPKRLLVRTLRVLQAEHLVDVLALEVPMTQQPAIREYLASDPEDVGILLSHPLLLRSHWGMGKEYLEIYRTVWSLNHQAEGRSRLDILAIDAPRGPPAVTSRRAALARYVNRDAVMELRVRRWLEENPGKRMLVFVGDLHALKDIEANVEFQGEFDRLTTLATRLGRWRPGRVYAALSDAAVEGHLDGATAIYRVAAAALRDAADPVAVPVSDALDDIASPVRLDPEESDGIRMQLLPRSYTLRRVTDLYIYYGTSPGLTPLDERER